MLDLHDRYYILGSLMTASGLIAVCLDPIIGLIGMIIGLIELFTAQDIRRKALKAQKAREKTINVIHTPDFRAKKRR